MFISLNLLGSLVLDINGTRLDAKFLRNTGAIDDYFTIIKNGGGGGAPPAPTGLVATPGNSQVALSWNAATGAATYNVKRSTTSGGPYSPIQTGVTTTSFTDTTVSNGTTYYYVVSGVSSGGQEGPNSSSGQRHALGARRDADSPADGDRAPRGPAPRSPAPRSPAWPDSFTWRPSRPSRSSR